MTMERHYIIEFHQVGNAVKVSAVDPVSMIEVSIVGPANASEEALRRNAVRKLEHVIAKRSPGPAARPGLMT